jgi:hypothetical protein
MSGGGINSSTDGAESDSSFSVSDKPSIQSVYEYRSPAPDPRPVEDPLVVPPGLKRVTTFLRGEHAGLVLTDYPAGALDDLLETAPIAITAEPADSGTPLGTRVLETGGPRPSLTGMEHLRLYLCGAGSDTASGKHELFMVIIKYGLQEVRFRNHEAIRERVDPERVRASGWRSPDRAIAREEWLTVGPPTRVSMALRQQV